jgi:hypothetical protein
LDGAEGMRAAHPVTPADRAPTTAAVGTARSGLNYRRLPLLAAAMLALLAGLWAGLLRLGWNLPHPGLSVTHGPLMVCGFLGTLISLERAVALGESWSYAAPILSGAGALALIAGVPDPLPAILITLGSLGLVTSFAAILRRQAALFTAAMGLGAVAWLIGNCLWMAGIPIVDMFAWWAGFLVLTIFGERLELSRLTGPGERNRLWFTAAAGILIAGLALSLRTPSLGLRVSGAAMLLAGFWLWRYDLARRTVWQQGLTRFIAANLLAGYFWLGAAGLAWLWFASDLTTFHYDVMLHAVFLGFVFSMIFAHAPIIFPAVLQRPLPYRPAFYVHSALLHLSLAVRIAGDLSGSYALFSWGGLLNVLAILLFVANTAGSIAFTAPNRGRQIRPAAAG